jgi:hypothetical protein
MQAQPADAVQALVCRTLIQLLVLIDTIDKQESRSMSGFLYVKDEVFIYFANAFFAVGFALTTGVLSAVPNGLFFARSTRIGAATKMDE